jgi:hypothetical protein
MSELRCAHSCSLLRASAPLWWKSCGPSGSGAVPCHRPSKSHRDVMPKPSFTRIALPAFPAVDPNGRSARRRTCWTTSSPCHPLSYPISARIPVTNGSTGHRCWRRWATRSSAVGVFSSCPFRAIRPLLSPTGIDEPRRPDQNSPHACSTVIPTSCCWYST